MCSVQANSPEEITVAVHQGRNVKPCGKESITQLLSQMHLHICTATPKAIRDIQTWQSIEDGPQEDKVPGPTSLSNSDAGPTMFCYVSYPLASHWKQYDDEESKIIRVFSDNFTILHREHGGEDTQHILAEYLPIDSISNIHQSINIISVWSSQTWLSLSDVPHIALITNQTTVFHDTWVTMQNSRHNARLSRLHAKYVRFDKSNRSSSISLDMAVASSMGTSLHVHQVPPVPFTYVQNPFQ